MNIITFKGLDWPSLVGREGDELETHYRHLLETLGKQKGLLGVIFRKAQNRIQDPAKLRRLVADLIDREQWLSLDADVKGDAYEGLLQKNAEDIKSGAGQYFTPRPLIQAIVEVMRPGPGMTICDPACGTGGFLLAAHDYMAAHYPLDKAQKQHLKYKALGSGWKVCWVNSLISKTANVDQVLNFCRVHQTLRCTPAMDAGIADHIWSLGELLAN